MAGHRPPDQVRGQALAAHTALARADAPGFLRRVRFLSFRRRQAGIVRRLCRFAKLCLKFRGPCRQGLNLRPKREDQRVLLGVAQVVEVRELGHAQG